MKPMPSMLVSVLIAILMAASGWVGAFYLVRNIHPTWPAQSLFLVVWAVALIGTAWPAVMALHRRFAGDTLDWIIWRRSIWIGAYGSLAVWLQWNRVFNAATAAILAAVFVVLEIILSLRAQQETQDD
jgi:hypothetical protein